MLRFSLGVTGMDKISNKKIRGTAEVRRFGGKVGHHIEMVGHVQRRVSEYIGDILAILAQDGATRQEAKMKIKKEIHGCGGRLADS